MRLLASLMLAVTLLFGSVAQATLLDQVNSAAPGTWVKVITENTATSINPDPQGTTTYRGNTGFLSVWEAWNSGVYVPTYGTCGAMIYYGGGHVDYYGNEVVAFDFCGDSGLPKWRLVTQPYAGSITFPTTNGTFADGTPSPSHNYDGIEYDPKTNNIWVSETQLNNLTATVTEKAMMFNVTSKTWSGPYAHRGALEGFTAWDTTRQLLWFMQ